MSRELQTAAEPGGALMPVGRDVIVSADRLRARLAAVQSVMRDVMKEDVHYGKIPGTDKPTLLKPGSELLLMTFQIAVSVHTDCTRTADSVSYVVRCVGTHTPSGAVVGEGIGECSSDEERYRWKKAWDDEYNDTPPDRRRLKHRSSRNGSYTEKQVRTNHADLANTVLKMAKKRAQIDMTLTALGCSDMFNQDLDERDPDADGERPAASTSQRSQQRSGGAARRQEPPDSPARAEAIRTLEAVAKAPDRMGEDGSDKLVAAWGAMDEATRNLVGNEWLRIRKIKPGGSAASEEGPL